MRIIDSDPVDVQLLLLRWNHCVLSYLVALCAVHDGMGEAGSAQVHDHEESFQIKDSDPGSQRRQGGD